ncbi:MULTISPECIES: hypothetical protein [unclassified Sphingomonas]|uniref:hypothetical protein n=1 Tax=unclassified Sphingomonas TaxID=196159 RepID=UPI00226AECE5|nr:MULTISPECIES: hypothetical protein [unclassified Sphingomonas]
MPGIMPQMEGSLFYQTKTITQDEALRLLNRINGIWARVAPDGIEYGISPMVAFQAGFAPNFAGHNVLAEATELLNAADSVDQVSAGGTL